MSLRYLAFAVIFVFSNFSFAQATTTFLRFGGMIDLESKKLTGPVTIIVDDDVIRDILKGSPNAPDDAKVLDLNTWIALPGLMDMHTHLSSEYNRQSYLQRFTQNPADLTVDAIVNAEKTLLSGFTTVRDLGDRFNVTVAVRKAIDANKVAGPRIYTSAKSIATTGGHADPSNGFRADLMGAPGPAEGVVNGVADARQAVRQRYKDGADLIKITATGGVLSVAKSGQNPQFMTDELSAIVETAKDYGMTVAVHAHGAEGMMRAVEAGVDSIEHGTYMTDAVMKQMKKRGTYYVPTLLAGAWVAQKSKVDDFFPALVRPKAAAIGPKIQDTFAKAYRAGVSIAFGTDSGVSAHGDNAQEFALMVAAGMSPYEAIESATLSAAKLLKIDQNAGQLAPGKWADIIAVRSSPLDNIRVLEDIAFVMKAGVVYKNEKSR